MEKHKNIRQLRLFKKERKKLSTKKLLYQVKIDKDWGVYIVTHSEHEHYHMAMSKYYLECKYEKMWITK